MPQPFTAERRAARDARLHRAEIADGMLEAVRDRLVAIGADDAAEYAKAARTITHLADDGIARAASIMREAHGAAASDAARRIIREAITELDGLA